MHVPFVDLRAQHEEVRQQIDAAIRDVLDTSAFIGGPRVETFERNYAAYCQTAHAVACANGTDALKLALMAAGVKAGDEVITTPHTFIATIEAIRLIGAHPVFVDIDPTTYNLSPDRLAEYLDRHCSIGKDNQLINTISGRPVTAIVPVHLYGLIADMEPILGIARDFGLRVIEDACQAHGATYELNGTPKRAGSLGATAAFSFYPGKNLGGIGEGGAVTTNDPQMDRTMRVLRDHGQSQKYVHVSADGWNGRLDTLQCAVLDIKLNMLDQWNAQRQRAATWYNTRLADVPQIEIPKVPAGQTHVFHLYVVRVPNRDAVSKELMAQGISTGLHYPIPLHLQEAWQNQGWAEGDFPETERAASSILSLPLFPHITEEQIDHVCQALRSAVGREANG
jgi:dTDP-4-amino-4,6-dideoxygalactose transaminase